MKLPRWFVATSLLAGGLFLTTPVHAGMAGTVWNITYTDFDGQKDCWRFLANGEFQSDILTINFGFPNGQWHESGTRFGAFQSDFTGLGGAYDFTGSSGGSRNAATTKLKGAYVESDTNRTKFTGNKVNSCNLPASSRKPGATGPVVGP